MSVRFLFTLAFGAALPVFAAYAAYFKDHGIDISYSGAMPALVTQATSASLKVGVVDETYTIAICPRDVTATVERTLWALGQIESGSNPKAIGRLGESSAYQFRRSAWRMACLTLGCRHKTITVHDETITKRHASAYLSWLDSQLSATLKRRPANVEIYCAWNLGFTGFQRRTFKVSRCPALTQDAALRFDNLLSDSRSIVNSGKTVND